MALQGYCMQSDLGGLVGGFFLFCVPPLTEAERRRRRRRRGRKRRSSSLHTVVSEQVITYTAAAFVKTMLEWPR
jgi:hypothetical protein